MKKALVLVIIQLVVVGAVLALTVVSFAWFTSNRFVYTEKVTVTSTMSSEIYLVVEPDDYVPYKGETGQGYNDPLHPELILDVPYSATKKFTMTVTPDSDQGYAFSSYYSEISIKKTNDEVIDITTDDQIMNSFTFRFHIYNENDEIIATYAPEQGTNFIILTSGDQQTNGSYLLITEETTLNCGFEMIFLDEASYAYWLNSNYIEVDAFRYCDISFMRATFMATFQVGLGLPAE